LIPLFELEVLKNIRSDFPLLKRKVNNKDLVYFDNAASTQKPAQVIKAINDLYSNYYSNIHRGVHTLSRESTEVFEQTRKKVAAFIGADEKEIVFTAGTTDGINLVASGISIPKGSEIILSTLEHHSNILPWQLWCEKNEGKLRILELNAEGKLAIEKLPSLLSEKTAVVAVTQVSNSLGIVNPLEKIIPVIRKFNKNIHILVDGAQTVAHMPVNVKKLDCDYFVFSGHKMYAPTGTGVLYGKKEKLESLQLSRSGGGTIKQVSFDKTEYAEVPLKFEPGTPNIEGIIGLGAAIDYINEVGMSYISEHEHQLLKYTLEHLKEINEIELYGASNENAGIVSFNVKGQHPFDVGTLLDMQGVAVRTGHHCCQPLMKHFVIPGTVRASFGVYNTQEEVDLFIAALKKTISMLK
jgi:cysteine desulfurase/selenocysteine lyase